MNSSNFENFDAENVPALRFPEFEGEWVKKKLGDIGEVKMCKRIFNEETQPFGEIPFFKIGSFGKEPDAFISRELYSNYKSRFSFPKKGDILISAAGTIGRTVVYDGQDAYYQDSNIVWIDNNYDTVSNEFLYYIYQIVKFNTEGGTIQRLYNNILRSTEFYKPTLPEQTKIASFLTAVDEKIQALKKKHRLLEQYKKGVMQQLFSQELRFKDENGEEFAEWEVKRLGELSKITTGKLDANAMVENGEYRFYTCAKDFYRIDKYAFDTEALLVSGNGANVGYIHYYKGKFNAYQRTYVLDSFEENIIYIKYFLNRFLYERINAEKKEGNTPYIVMSALSEMTILIPSLPEQTLIATFLSSLDEKTTQTARQIEKMEVWKKGLLQKMFV